MSSYGSYCYAYNWDFEVSFERRTLGGAEFDCIINGYYSRLQLDYALELVVVSNFYYFLFFYFSNYGLIINNDLTGSSLSFTSIYGFYFLFFCLGYG